MSSTKTSTNSQRITQKEKDLDKKKYYKDKLDSLDTVRFSRADSIDGISEHGKMKVNYDLFNNKINIQDLAYVCQPFGAETGQLPAEMVNRDIMSGKIKAVLGMEAKRPFDWRLLAVNEEATTRKEQEEFKRVREFVVSNIMTPIQQSIELKHQQEQAGRELTAEEQQQLQEQIAQETKAQTPDEVRKYMVREHQDPAEALSNQILKYLIQKQKIKEKFAKGLKHACLSGREVFWVGIANGEPILRVVNSMAFDYAKSSDIDCIEDAEDGVAEFRMTPSQVITQFRDELTEKEIDDIYENYDTGSPTRFWSEEHLFTFGDDNGVDNNTLRVLYGAWKSERRIGFLKYRDQNGQPQEMIVPETYKLDATNGDISVTWDWIPEVHQGYKINNDIYVGCGPVEGQHRDMDNLFECKLPFIGVDHDDMNSDVTSLADRMKGYQYFYNVIIFRIELLMASDKGKILMMNINAVPTSAGIDLKKFQHFLESNKIAYYNPNEEKNKKGLADVNTVGKVIDMSLASEISQYMQMAEYIERRCGESVGIPKGVEGSISADESVRNAQMNISQSSNILEPMFQLHNSVKRNVLQRLVDVAKVAYSQGKPRKLSYMLDDFSQALINLDEGAQALLDNSTLGIFVTDSTNAFQAKQTVEQLAHAAMQTQQIDLLDVVKVIRSEGIQEAEELLEVGTMKKADRESERQQIVERMRSENAKAERLAIKEAQDTEHKYKLAEIDRKGEWDVKKQTILSMGFNEDKDLDDDGTPDVLEVAKFGVEAQIKARELTLKERTQTENNAIAKEKIEVDKEKNSILKKKSVSAN